MKKNTYLGNTLENAGNKAKYDAVVKMILSDKKVLEEYGIRTKKVEEYERISKYVK